MSYRLSLLAVAFISLSCHSTSRPTPSAAESGAYVVRLGSDTVAIDSYTRVGDRAEGTFMARAPVTAVTKYVIVTVKSSTPRHWL